jgi:flagellar hook-associated protein 3 FlgL
MAVNGVSTFQVFQQTLTDVIKVQTELTQQQGQLSSGNKSRDFAGIANQLQQYLSLNESVSKSDQYLNDNQIIIERLDTTSSILNQLITTATELNSLISQRRTGVQSNGAFNLQLDGKWQIIASQLNTSSSGRYLFSGTKVDSPAVDTTAFPTLSVPGVPDDSYYLGSEQDITAQADDNVSLIYNVRADDPGFQKIFAGMALAKQANDENSDVLFQQAFTFIQEGVQDIISVRAKVDANKVSVTDVNKTHESFKLYWKGLQESIGNTDILSVSTEVAVNQGILQAAFQAFAKINSLRLSDFLR